MIDTTDKSAIIGKLSHLIELDFDAIAAYEQAIERLDNINFSEALTAFKNDHQRHIEVLAKLVINFDGVPPNSGDAKKILTQGKVVLADIAGDKAILKAMLSNEEQTNKAYAEAQEEFAGAADIRAIISENYEDERRHKAWIERTLDRYEEEERVSYRDRTF